MPANEADDGDSGESKVLPGNRGKFGQATVAPVKAWRDSPAEAPQPLTAAEVNTSPLPCAMVFTNRSDLASPLVFDGGLMGRDGLWVIKR